MDLVGPTSASWKKCWSIIVKLTELTKRRLSLFKLTCSQQALTSLWHSLKVVLLVQRLLQLPFNVCHGHPSFCQHTVAQTKLYCKAQPLSATYSCDISNEFKTQLLSFRALFHNDIKQIVTVAELADFLIVRNYSLVPMFQDMYAAFLLFLILPVTVATAERSFSKLKLIKHYLRNSMLQDRLSTRTGDFVHWERGSAKTWFDKIIEDFARLRLIWRFTIAETLTLQLPV